MANREKLDSEILEGISGGYVISQMPNGDYALGPKEGKFTHYFKAEDYDTICKLAAGFMDPKRSFEDNMDVIYQQLAHSNLTHTLKGKKN